MSDPTARPLRRISSWKVFGLFCLVSFLFLLGVVFVPWDIRPVEAPDLELKVPKIAPADNAFTWFEKAQNLIVWSVAQGNPGRDDWDCDHLAVRIQEGLGIWEPNRAGELLTANAAALEKFEKGLACQHYVSPKWESERMGLPWLQRHKALAMMVCLKSKYLQLTGDQSGAVKPALQLLRFGKLIMDGSNNLYEWEVGVAVERSALARLEEIVADAGTPEPALREIQAELDRWNPAGMVAGGKNAMRGEYQCRVQTIREILDGRYRAVPDEVLIGRYVPYLIKPNMADRQAADFFRHQISSLDLPYAQAIAASSNLSGYQNSILGMACFYIKPNSMGDISSDYRMQAIEYHPVAGTRTNLQAHLSALRLKIALQLYENQHGQLPDDLQALVPEFIKEVPNDPFVDQPFRHSKGKRLIWSVGSDGKDNDGAWAANMVPTPVMRDLGCGHDLVMPLGTRELNPDILQSNSSVP
jgi:hypothetical protein